MKRLQTLRVRFALWTAGLLLIVLLLFGFFVYVNMSRSLATSVDETLHLMAMELLSEAEVDNGELILLENPIEDTQYTRLREQGLSMRIFSKNGQLVQEYGPYQTLPQPDPKFIKLLAVDAFTTITDPVSQELVRVYTMPVTQADQVVGVLQVAQNLNHIANTLRLLRITLLLGVPLVVLIAGGGGYFLAARALAPIDKITQTARSISAKDLSARLSLPETEDEVGRLAATFNSMLVRLDNAFQRERQFTADASHELRTPLAAMQTIIGSTVTRRRTPAEYEQALFDLNQEAKQMHTLVESLLQVARHDSTQQTAKFDDVQLALLLKDVIDSLQPLAEEKGMKLIDQVPEEDLTLPGDSDGLIRLFVNLIDNAIKYTEKGSVTIAAKRQAGNMVVVTIHDTGVGIAPEHLSHIFDRFYRADDSRSTEGTGLGLAIARDIAQAHGGEITVESEVGKGATFTVQLSTKVTGIHSNFA